jgi:hypothetical protein
MTTGEKFLVGTGVALAAGLIVYLIGIAVGWWKNPFITPAPSKSDYDKCVEANKSKADGENCSFCIEPGNSEIYEKGIIKNGKCVIQTPDVSRKYVVSNPQGATVYTLQGNMFVAPRIPNKIPAGTQIKILSISMDGKYVNTQSGWILATDIVKL